MADEIIQSARGFFVPGPSSFPGQVFKTTNICENKTKLEPKSIFHILQTCLYSIMVYTEELIQYKNIGIAENGVAPSSSSKLGLFTITGAFIVFSSTTCEIVKQVSNYSINYYNSGTYPLPQTLLVMLSEVLKLCGTFLCMKCRTPSFDQLSVKASFKYIIPSVIYAVNNNIYLGKGRVQKLF